MASRTENSMRNMIAAWAMQIITMLLAFASRTIFVKLLPAEYLGLSGVFSNIISLLSLSEMGIGSAIIVNLYKPIADHDLQRVRQLMSFYAEAYRAIGLFVIVCGIILLPFIPYICKTDVPVQGMQLYFLVFVAQSASSYFFAYRRSILTAYQQEYICTISTQVSGILTYALQIGVLYLTGSYLLYLLVGIGTNVANNLFMYYISGKKFQFLKGHMKDKLPREERKGIFKDVGSMMVLKVGRVVVDSTDNILISSYLGLIWNGLYSNYLLLITTVNTFVNIVFNAISASVGDYNASKSANDVYSLYKTTAFIGYWIYGFCSICFAVLFQPFIEFWIGNQYLLDYATVLVVILNFYCAGMVRVSETFSYVAKLFHKTRKKGIVMAGVNLTSSIVLMRYLGLKGVFLGTVCGYAACGLWLDAYYLYKITFKKHVYKYLLNLVGNTSVVVIVGIVTYSICQLFENFIVKAALCIIVSNVFFFVIYSRTKEFKAIIERLIRLIGGRMHRQ